MWWGISGMGRALVAGDAGECGGRRGTQEDAGGRGGRRGTSAACMLFRICGGCIYNFELSHLCIRVVYI